jgi:hypothetical protein
MRLEREFADASFGDRRLAKRLLTIVGQFDGQPDLSYPEAAGDNSALEGTYRFLNNSAVTPERILAGHFAATVDRISKAGRVVVAHDSTEFLFRRPEMGSLGEGRKGFLGHFAFAVEVDGERRAPLGVIAMEALLRDPHEQKGRKRRSPHVRHRAKDSEELRWFRTIEEAEVRIGKPTAIHVMDREADNYELFARLVQAGYRFVIRTYYDRVVVPAGAQRISRRRSKQWPRMTDVLGKAPALLKVEVPVSPRKAVRQPNKIKPAREARVATLEYASSSMEIAQPFWTQIDGPPSLRINVVQVREAKPPAGCEPVEWRLITTEPVDTPDQVSAVIDAYRARWTIEEYFRALKQGCAYEKRQLENRHAIVNALAVFVPLAWDLLALRTAARVTPNVRAEAVIDDLKLQLLKLHPKLRLPRVPRARDVMLAIAQLGGHIRNNGDPGWIVLGRGFERLLLLEEGALLSRGICDQS